MCRQGSIFYRGILQWNFLVSPSAKKRGEGWPTGGSRRGAAKALRAVWPRRRDTLSGKGPAFRLVSYSPRIVKETRLRGMSTSSTVTSTS